jgi:hypothetical protein
MPVSGFYINLDRSTDRNATMQQQLASLALLSRYSRFSAIDGATQSDLTSTRSAGEVGCFMSHLRLLQQNIDGTNHLHVMEDDAILSNHAAEVIDRMISPGGVLEQYDIIMTDGYPTSDIGVLSFYKNIVSTLVAAQSAQGNGSAVVRVMDISDRVFDCTSSYLVNRVSIPKICFLLEKTAVLAPIDLVLKSLAKQGLLRIGVTLPFITSVPINDRSTIHPEDGADRVRLAGALVRRALFLDCDAGASLDEARVSSAPHSIGRDDLILTAAGLMLSLKSAPG